MRAKVAAGSTWAAKRWARLPRLERWFIASAPMSLQVGRAQLQRFADAGERNLGGVVETPHALSVEGLKQAQTARFLRQEKAADIANRRTLGGKPTGGLRRGSMGGSQLVPAHPG